MSRFLIVIIFLYSIGYSECIMTMNDSSYPQLTYKTFNDVAHYLHKTGCQQLYDYGDLKIIGAIIAHNFNISQEQIELLRYGLHDYNDPEIRAIIVANDYQISQKKIDIIKNAVKSAIVYYDQDDNFIMVARGDKKIVNSHNKVQSYTTYKKFDLRSIVPYDVNKMPRLSENDQDDDVFTL